MLLKDKLIKYKKQNFVPMHMPGHKRNTKLLGNDFLYDLDITEIEGFDNLHDANSCLKQISDFASKVYNTKKSFMLVNGSTCGILAGIHALTKCGDKIIVARNCHKSVYNAIELFQLNCSYLYPKIDEKTGICESINPKDVEEALKKNRGAKLVVVTSPTYEGVMSDIIEIAKVVHKYNALLFVDEAHGAHLYFNENFCTGAINCGADLVVQSLHKTLPALTQCALLHICSERIDDKKISNSLSVFETSSPSYILMSSIEECLHFVFKNRSKFNQLSKNLVGFYNITDKLKNLKILKIEDFKHAYAVDKTKIVVLTNQSNITGIELASLLRKNKIEVEMSCANYVVAITSVCDSKENLFSFANALVKIDEKLKKSAILKKFKNIKLIAKHPAFEDYEKKQIDFANSEGEISEEYVYVYPPGIPFIVKGEEISKEVIEYVFELRKNGLDVKSTFSDLPDKIYIKNP